MQSNLPKLKTKYTFTLIDTVTNKVKQCIKTHNEMTPYFWYYEDYYSGGLSISLSRDTTKPDIANGTIKNILWSISASDQSKPRKNTIKYICVVPAQANYVGVIGSFGITYNSAEKLCTGGLLVDAEGNNFTINKTALDKLIIEIEWEFQFVSNDFVWLEDEESAIINCALFYTGSAFDDGCVMQGMLGNAISISTLPVNKGIVNTLINSFDPSGSYKYYYINGWFATISPSWVRDKVSDHFYKYVETAVTRLVQDSLPGRYINNIGIVGIGAITLPNNNVFPVYTLQNIAVGTGDGNTTEFECPIPWFLQNTDKLYKNGQLLNRDIDYTIDHKHNRQKCLSISEGNFAKVISGSVKYLGSNDGKRTSVSVWGSPFIPFAACIDAYNSYKSTQMVSRIAYLTLHTEKPLILDMEKAVEINCFISPYIASSYANKMQLWYSNDNKDYTQACEVSVLHTALNGTDSIPSASVATFETITARYWKVIVTTSNNRYKEFEFPSYYNNFTEHKVEETKTKMSKRCGFLGYVGEPIKFKTPPAKGDIITMDVSLDRPYKTTQNVIDIAFKYTY